MIRVLLVDDSQVALAVLKQMLGKEPTITVVGTAGNGCEALELIPRLRPNVVCTDLHMPRMGGLELTREIMARFPLPILVVSISVQKGGDDDNIFRLLEAGAIDVFPKPEAGLNAGLPERTVQEFITRIKVLSGVLPIRRIRSLASARSEPLPPVVATGRQQRPRMVAIGASTGGPQALSTLFSELPEGFGVPIVCVQHISNGFLKDLVEWLRKHTRLGVEIAVSGGVPRAGCIYFPPEDVDLRFARDGSFELGHCGDNQLHCPAIDSTFSAVAAHFGAAAVGVLLTGMGRDGARGLREIAEHGGVTAVQDEESSVVFGMPREAILLGAAGQVLSIDRMGAFLLGVVDF